MKAKLTAKELYYSERCENYKNLTPGQQASFRGLVTWLAHNTSPDTEDAKYIGYITELTDIPRQDCKASLAQAIENSVKQIMVPVYKLLMVKDGGVASSSKRIHTPAEAAQLAMTYLTGLDREHLVVILLDSKNMIIGINTVCIGTLNTAYVSMREVFKPAIVANAAAIFVAHNHPSGDPTPSSEDVHITKQISEAGKLLDIPLLDHIVCGETNWVSLKERGLGF